MNTCGVPKEKKPYIPLYPNTATAIVSSAHKTYNRAMAALSAQSFLHLVHSFPSWIPVEKQKNNLRFTIAGKCTFYSNIGNIISLLSRFITGL